MNETTGIHEEKIEMTTGETMKALRQKAGLTLAQVGDAVGVGKSTVRKWETGAIQNMRRDKIQALAKILGTTPLYLLGIEENNVALEEKKETSDLQKYGLMEIQTQRMPLLGEIACGTPILAVENTETYVEVGSDINADFCLRAKGDSMVGARIFDGDLVFVRQQDMVENGEIAVVVIDDEATLKRMQYNKETGTMWLMPENPSYAPLCIVGEELNHVRILGKAVSFHSNIR